MMNWKQIAAVATVTGVIIVAWFGLWTMMDRRSAELRNDNAALRNDNAALRNEVRRDLERWTTRIAEDVGYLRGRI